MTIRIKRDRIEFTANGGSTFTMAESNTGFTFDGIIQASNIFQDGFQGTVAGFNSGAGPFAADTNDIQKFLFATDGNAANIADLTQKSYSNAGQSSMTTGYVSGAYSSEGPTSGSGNVIRKFLFASASTTSQFGSLTSGRGLLTGHSSSINGYSSGGSPPYPPGSNVIDKFPFATDAAATDVGDLTAGRYGVMGQSSTISGYTSGGFPLTNTIDKFPFATDSNSTDIGDLSLVRSYGTGQSSTTHGYTSGGLSPPQPVVRVNNIDKFPFATDTNATDVGDLTQPRMQTAGQSSTIFGYTSGGNDPAPVNLNTIDKFPFSADTSATDVGDLSVAASASAGQQD